MRTTKFNVCYRPYHAASAIHGLRNDEQFLIMRSRPRATDGALVAEPDREAESFTGSSKRRESEDRLGETHAVLAAKECSTRVRWDFWRNVGDVLGQRCSAVEGIAW